MPPTRDDLIGTIGAVLLTPVGNGSRFVGATIESFIDREFANGVLAIQGLTAAWIAENG